MSRFTVSRADFFFEGDWGLSGDFYMPDLHPCPRCPAASSWPLIPHKQEANINNLHKHDLDKNEGGSEIEKTTTNYLCSVCTPSLSPVSLP